MIRLACLAALLPGLALAQADGRYDTNPACPAGSDGAVTLAGDRISFHESICALTNPVPVRDMTGAVLYDALCTGEGTDWAKRILLMPAPDGGLIRVEDGFAITYSACKGA